MSTEVERLYHLLPAFVRQQDHIQDEPLRALMAIFEAELRTLERRTESQWDDWFIETCADSVVPYIAQAVGVRGIRSLSATGFSARAYVANTLAYRRRKGTAFVLEQLARDLTRHGSRAVEYFQRLVVAPHLQHLQHLQHGMLPATLGTVALGNSGLLERLGGPFAADAHTPDLRHIERGGLWNLPNVGIHLWTLQSLSLARSQARPIAGQPGWYATEPFGRPIPMFNLPVPETDISSTAGPEHVPRALSRLELAREERGANPPQWLGPSAVIRVHVVAEDGTQTLHATAGDLVFDTTGDGVPDTPQMQILVGGQLRPRLRIAHLADLAGAGLPTRRPADPQIVHFDPENGRLVFHPDAVDPEPAAVLVDYAVGHASEVGAGPWDRTQSLQEQLAAHDITLSSELTAQWGVSRTQDDGSEVFPTLGDALDAWNTHVAASTDADQETGLIVMMDSRAYTRADSSGTAVNIDLPGGSRLLIAAADWPLEQVEGIPTRVLGSLGPSRLRPIILDRLVASTDPTTLGIASRAGGLWLNGLAIEQGVRVLPGGLERLSLRHCTTATQGSGITIESGAAGTSNPLLTLHVVRCSLGAVRAMGPTSEAKFKASIVAGRDSITLADANVTIDDCTVLGTSRARVLFASDSIFADRVEVEHTQAGCVRFCYVTLDSRVPRRYRCQPDLALAQVSDPDMRAQILGRVRPIWTTLDPAHPAYAQLTPQCPRELLRGAQDGLEMGVFFHRQLPWREDNLRTALRQSLRHGLDAGLRYEN